LEHLGYYLVICASEKDKSYTTKIILDNDLSLNPIYILNVNNNHFVAVVGMKLSVLKVVAKIDSITPV